MNEAKLSMQRKRAQNLSEKEKLILTEILKYKSIIKNKRIDRITSKDEKSVEVIENNYNSTSSSTEFRNAEVLKSCWENLKKKTQKFLADERIKLYKSGGGPYKSQSEYLQENAGAMRQNSFDNVSDGHEMTNYDKENDVIENDSVSDVNGDSPVFMRENNKQRSLKKSNIQNIQKPEKQDVQNISAVQVLKRKISTPLQVKTNVLNDQYKSRKLNRQDKLYKKKEDTIISRMSQFDMLTKSKIKLAECMTDDFKAKSEIEMQILSTRLKKEQLEVQILEKELLLQEHRLQREVQQNKSSNVS